MHSLDSQASTRKDFGQVAELRDALNTSSSMMNESEIRTCSCKAFRPEIVFQKTRTSAIFVLTFLRSQLLYRFFSFRRFQTAKAKRLANFKIKLRYPTVFGFAIFPMICV